MFFTILLGIIIVTILYVFSKFLFKKKPKTISALNHPIKPEEIRTETHWFEAFGNYETEVSALFLVLFAKKNGCWRDFTKKEIDKFTKRNFDFYELTDGKYQEPTIKVNNDKTYSFTSEFIERCYKYSQINWR